MGEGKPHPRYYGTFPRKIRHFVLEQKTVSLAHAIRSMTSLPADKFNLQGRGKLARNHYADIAVINLDTITDHATVSDPHQYAEGITHLLVNGIPAIANGVATGTRGGSALRKT